MILSKRRAAPLVGLLVLIGIGAVSGSVAVARPAQVRVFTIGSSLTGRKAGETSAPVVLRVAGSTGSTADYFQKRVQQLSHGALRLEVVDAWDDQQADAEQREVKYVASGTADLGWVRTWVFDTLGVRSFQALTAPMLIDSYPLERAVLATDMQQKMLGSLGKLNVTGLAILAEGLRKPIAVKRPLLGPADWRGLGFGVVRSKAKSDAIRIVGAHPADAVNSQLTTYLDSGKVQAFEMGLNPYVTHGLEDAARYVTVNVNLWPGMYAVLVNPARLATLSSQQQGWLRKAAADASARSTGLVDNEQSLIATACKSGLGARFAVATDADLAALRAAFAPALTELARDPQTRTFIAQIERLKKTVAIGKQLAIPARCKAPTR
jgi:TRAP-type C4-dicarboxylate transport system substrate-binding protein